MGLTKLALIREAGAPIGVPAPLHCECPCGTVIPMPDAFADPQIADVAICSACGLGVDPSGWIVYTPDPPYVCPACGSRECDRQSSGGYDGVLCGECRHYGDGADFLGGRP